MKKLIDNPSLGADPELFVFDKVQQKFRSSVGMIGAGKWNPKEMEKGFFAQEDNVLVEFNIPPAKTKGDFVFNIESGRWQIKRLLGDRFELRAQASAFIPMEELETPEAWEFGCDPDMNAWDRGKVNQKPETPQDGLRSAGGHIHFGFSPNENLLREMEMSIQHLNVELIKLCDLYLGVPSILMDTDKERRKLYGKAGAFRHKPYGVEYRVLSSFWLDSKKHIAWAWNQSMRALERASEGDFVKQADGEEIAYTINQASETSAKALCDKFSLAIA